MQNLYLIAEAERGSGEYSLSDKGREDIRRIGAAIKRMIVPPSRIALASADVGPSYGSRILLRECLRSLNAETSSSKSLDDAIGNTKGDPELVQQYLTELESKFDHVALISHPKIINPFAIYFWQQKMLERGDRPPELAEGQGICFEPSGEGSYTSL